MIQSRYRTSRGKSFARQQKLQNGSCNALYDESLQQPVYYIYLFIHLFIYIYIYNNITSI